MSEQVTNFWTLQSLIIHNTWLKITTAALSSFFLQQLKLEEDALDWSGQLLLISALSSKPNVKH